jgi:type I restriction enzyme M protein
MDNCQIEAIISLPQFTFSHFGAGVKSSLVFLRRKGKEEILGDYPIFMAIADYIGYDASGRTTQKDDLPLILDEYKNFKNNPSTYKGKSHDNSNDLFE